MAADSQMTTQYNNPEKYIGLLFSEIETSERTPLGRTIKRSPERRCVPNR